MSADFLLELRCEEIPARMQEKARTDLASLFDARLKALNLPFEKIESYATPRRLALIVRDVAESTLALSEERKGPRADAPAQAIEGFLRSTGLTREQLEVRDMGKAGQVLFAVINRPGVVAGSVLASAISGVIHNFPWPKSMRWGAASSSTESLRWVRPLQGIIALLGDKLVPVEVAGVKSGAETVGHRFHHPKPIRIISAADYADKLRDAYVIFDGAERRAIIAVGAKLAAQKAGLTLVEDEGLLYENAGLTEFPVPLLGRFDPEFLTVPPEVIQLTARVNQKYFVCRDADGKLANAFICTANIDAADGGAKIVEGNQKVLAARLSDARHFWLEDQFHRDATGNLDLTNRRELEDRFEKLRDIVFHEKLGTVADKVDRVAKLARWLAEKGIVNADPDQAERAARLAKADLVTGMVGEFPELQGLMGGYYAAAQGEATEVAEAVRDHYKPVGQGDDVPTAPVTVAVALADKLDSVAGFFMVGLKPSGSKDPFALRRSALGALALIMRNALSGDLREWLIFARRSYVDQGVRDELPEEQPGETAHEAAEIAVERVFMGHLRDFFADRLKVQQKEAGVRHDLIDAVFALGGEDDLVRLLARVHALQAFVTTEDGKNLLAGYKRAANILKKEEWTSAEQKPLSYTPDAEEAALIAALDAAAPVAASAIEREDFEGAMAALASLRAPIDAFFDKITVNDSDSDKRAARLSLLARMRAAVHSVADFSKIDG